MFKKSLMFTYAFIFLKISLHAADGIFATVMNESARFWTGEIEKAYGEDSKEAIMSFWKSPKLSDARKISNSKLIAEKFPEEKDNVMLFLLPFLKFDHEHYQAAFKILFELADDNQKKRRLEKFLETPSPKNYFSIVRFVLFQNTSGELHDIAKTSLISKMHAGIIFEEQRQAAYSLLLCIENDLDEEVVDTASKILMQSLKEGTPLERYENASDLAALRSYENLKFLGLGEMVEYLPSIDAPHRFLDEANAIDEDLKDFVDGDLQRYRLFFRVHDWTRAQANPSLTVLGYNFLRKQGLDRKKMKEPDYLVAWSESITWVFDSLHELNDQTFMDDFLNDASFSKRYRPVLKRLRKIADDSPSYKHRAKALGELDRRELRWADQKENLEKLAATSKEIRPQAFYAITELVGILNEWRKRDPEEEHIEIFFKDMEDTLYGITIPQLLQFGPSISDHPFPLSIRCELNFYLLREGIRKKDRSMIDQAMTFWTK